VSAKLAFALLVGVIMVIGCGSAATPTLQQPQSPSSTATATATAISAPTAPPTLSPTASASLPAVAATVPIEWTTYESSRYAYSVDYPTDWIATPASQDWPPTGFSYPDDPAIDKWVMPSPSPSWVLMFVSSVPLADGEDAAKRIARLDADNDQVCEVSNRRDITIEGVAARQEDGTCFGSDYISEVAAVNSRFYLLYVLSGSPLSETSLATFDHFLGSFRFA